MIDGPAEFALFATGLLLAHALLIGLVYLVVRALHGRRRDTPLFLLTFLFVAVGGGVAFLVGKFEVLSYFSDALGFELIRNLGGGSLVDAMLFVADDAALVLLAVVAAALGWWLALRLMRRFLPPHLASGWLKWRHLLWPALALPFVALAVNRVPDVRYGLARFTAFGLANNLLAQASDFDRDGYSWFTPQRDAFAFDASRHPFVLDIPDNGIDEDGLGGDFHFAGPAPAAAPPKLPPHPKHLVMIVLESTRGDAIGRTVGGRPVTPVLNALAREGTYVREAYSHVGFTTESLKSLFSGTLSPRRGGPSLFRDMKANGYRIGVFSGQPESFGDISEVVGMKENADIFVDAETMKNERAFSFAAKGSLLLDGRKLIKAFDARFRRRGDWAQPTFLYFNFQEAHFPYDHPGMMRIVGGKPIPRSEISLENRDWVARTYWNAVASDDRLIGALIARLKAMGVWEDTLLLVTADHGESLFDDAFLGHGHVINRQQTQVPLILNQAGLDVPAPVGLYDYRSLVLRTLGADVPFSSGARPVFQHIGALATPAAIGMVERGGVWTTFQFETEEVGFGDGGRRQRYGDLRPGSPERARADRLIDEWARQRWIEHLAGGGE